MDTINIKEDDILKIFRLQSYSVSVLKTCYSVKDP